MAEGGRDTGADFDAAGYAARVAAASRHWLAEEVGSTLPAGCTLRPALPVCAGDGTLEGWFVPVVAGNRIVACLRFTPRGARRGLSHFTQQPGVLATCPPLADWLDRAHIAARAQGLGQAGERAGEPTLSFAGSPEHLAWRVPLMAEGRAVRWIFVSGNSVWASADE